MVGPLRTLLEQGPSLEVLKIGPRSVPLDADYLTGENVLETHAQRKYDEATCISRVGSLATVYSNQKGIRSRVYERSSISPQNALVIRQCEGRTSSSNGGRPPAAWRRSCLARGAAGRRETVPLRVPTERCPRTTNSNSSSTSGATLPLSHAVTLTARRRPRPSSCTSRGREVVLDARQASIVAERACLDDFDDEDAAKGECGRGDGHERGDDSRKNGRRRRAAGRRRSACRGMRSERAWPWPCFSSHGV